MKSVSPRRVTRRKPPPAAQGDGPVEVAVGVLVRRAVARAVGQEQRLTGVGQRDDQGVVAPDAVVGDVHALLAPALGRGERAIGIDDGLVEEGGGVAASKLAGEFR